MFVTFLCYVFINASIAPFGMIAPPLMLPPAKSRVKFKGLGTAKTERLVCFFYFVFILFFDASTDTFSSLRPLIFLPLAAT